MFVKSPNGGAACIRQQVSMRPDNEIRVALEDPSGPAGALLIQDLSAELGAMYGDDGSGDFAAADVQVPGAAFVIAWMEERPVGCGALRPLAPGVGELKRMFVVNEARRRGVGRRILAELEELARNLGYTSLRLETGIRMGQCPSRITHHASAPPVAK
jgi:putative acetyltransferase